MVLTRRKLLSMLFSVGAISQIPKLKTESLFTTSSPKGIDFVLRNSPTSRKYLVETMPGGTALLDYDNDGFRDIYVTNFGRNILYHNNGDGTFTDVTAKAGVGAGGWSASPAFLTTTTMGISTCS